MSHARVSANIARALLCAFAIASCASAPRPAPDTEDTAYPPPPDGPARAVDTTSTRRPEVRAAPLPADAPPAEARVAEWERAFPGERIPASVVFERVVSDAELLALLDRHGAAPYAGHVRLAGMGGEYRVPSERAGAAAIAGTRQTALQVARQGTCHVAARLESWAIEVPAGWPEAALLDQARMMLAQREAARRAEAGVQAGEPVIYAVQVLLRPDALSALAAEPVVRSVEPAFIRDDGLVLVPAPLPLPQHEISRAVVTEGLKGLDAAGLMEQMRLAGAAPRPDCDPRGYPPPPTERDTSAVEDRPTSTIPPAVHPVFTIRGTALGTLRPGEAVDIVARVEADAVVDTAVFLVTLPELANARRTGWDAAYEPLGIGVPYPSLDSIVGRMAPGAPLLLRRRVTFHAPGYYLVSMVVRARTRPITDRRLPTVDEAYHSFLIRIDEEGGFVASELDQTRYPVGSDNQGGPVRMTEHRAPERELIERARTQPATRATLRGTVRTPDGRPVADVRITGRAYMQGCPGRAAAETVTRTGADGRYTLELKAWPAESFIACVAIHADPPASTGLASQSVRTELRFLRNPDEPHELDIVLQSSSPMIDPAAALPLPEPVPARASAPAYSAVVQTLEVDVTGDGATDRIELSADAELNARGDPIFEHGHRWRVIVRSAAGVFPLYDDFVPGGDVRVRIETRAIDEPDAPPTIVIAWRSRESWGERRLRYHAAIGAFGAEAIVRVMPE